MREMSSFDRGIIGRIVDGSFHLRRKAVEQFIQQRIVGTSYNRTVKLIICVLEPGSRTLAQGFTSPLEGGSEGLHVLDGTARAGEPRCLDFNRASEIGSIDFKSASGKPDGLDIRLVALLARKLGLTAQFHEVKFPAIVPGVAVGRFDVGVNQIGVTAERQKVVAFVPYYNSGYGLLVRHGVTGVDINHLCGRTLVLTQGSAQVADAETLSEACVKAGQKETHFLFYPDSADTYLALANGRGDGFLTDRAVGVYIASKNDKLAIATGVLPGMTTVSGIVVGKDNDAMHKALLLALEAAVSDGSYQAIMNAFGVPNGALTATQIRDLALR
jgi:polar amino acid transport system substrate-binding protein